MKKQDLGDMQPEIAASIIAEESGHDPDDIFVVATETAGRYSELFRGNLTECLEFIKSSDHKEETYNIVQVDAFTEINPTLN